MKYISLFFLLFNSINANSQDSFTSPFTHYFPSGLIETIDREIFVENEFITIVTQTEDGKDIHTLRVESRMVDSKEQYESITYKCTSNSGQYYLVWQKNNDAPYLSIFPQNGQTNPTEIRLLLD